MLNDETLVLCKFSYSLQFQGGKGALEFMLFPDIMRIMLIVINNRGTVLVKLHQNVSLSNSIKNCVAEKPFYCCEKQCRRKNT